MMGTYYAYASKRSPRQVLRLHNLALKHSLAFKSVLTPPKTMSYRKMFGIYYHAIVDHAPFLYRLICLRSINAELFERFFDRIDDITRKTWSKHAEDLISNAFLHIQGEDAQEEDNDVMATQERERAVKTSQQPSQEREHRFQQHIFDKELANMAGTSPENK
jgi:hypothetical protein